jgi:hypothetical protein
MIQKLWRYNGFDPDTRRIRTDNNPATGEPWIYKNPEVFAVTAPDTDYTEIEIPTASTELRDRVLADPSNSYRIYKYLLADVAAKNKSVTVPPKGVEYVKEVSPKLQKRIETIDARGALTNIEWWAYDVVTDTWIEPVLKVWINWYYKNDATIKAAESILYREVFRQWILEDGTYKELGTEEEIKNDLTDVKYTYKRYHKVDDPTTPEYNLSSREGQRRRENIQRLGEERFITLTTALVTNWDQTTAENLGKALIRKYTDEYTEYKENGDRSFVDIINSDGDAAILTDILGKEITAGVSSLSLLSTLIPATVNHPLLGTLPIEALVPGANTVSSIRDFIVEKYKGEI